MTTMQTRAGTSHGSRARDVIRSRQAMLLCLAVLAAPLAAAASEDPAAAPDIPAPQQRPAGAGAANHARRGTIEERIRLLATELGLDERQQAQVRQILERQRDEVRRTWNDTTLPAAHRIGRTQAIADRTAADIRALLSDEQRQKYLAARDRRTGGESARADLDYWLDVSQGGHAPR